MGVRVPSADQLFTARNRNDTCSERENTAVDRIKDKALVLSSVLTEGEPFFRTVVTFQNSDKNKDHRGILLSFPRRQNGDEQWEKGNKKGIGNWIERPRNGTAIPAKLLLCLFLRTKQETLGLGECICYLR